VPLVYLLSEAQNQRWPPALFANLQSGLVAVLLLVWFVGLTFVIWKAMSQRATPKTKETIPFGLTLWIVPALLIALPAKYQHELHFGLGYLPVFLEYFGAGIAVSRAGVRRCCLPHRIFGHVRIKPGGCD
jgi:hypothetical protein